MSGAGLSLTERMAEEIAASFRQATGQPIYIPQAMYDHMRDLGMDLANVSVVPKIPLCDGRV